MMPSNELFLKTRVEQLISFENDSAERSVAKSQGEFRHELESVHDSTSIARTMVGNELFAQNALSCAPQLPGLIMVRPVAGVVRRARLVEVEAYLGPKDLASHASKGRTARTEVMFGPPGRAYVYFIYGMHWMFNVVVGHAGEAEAVLFRAALPLDGWAVDLSGPAKLARACGISRLENGMDLTGDDLYFVREPDYRSRIRKSKRIGVDYAGRWKDRLLRFVDVQAR